MGAACLLCAALFAARPQDFPRAEKALARLSEAHGHGLLLAGCLLPLLLAFYNLARYEIYYLTADSAVNANVAWNAAHGNGLRTMILGDHSFLTLHFSFAVALFSPFLWLWNSAAVLAVAQGLAVGSAPLALFALARKSTKAALIPWLALATALAHPRFNELLRTVVDNSPYALPFFLWAAYFLETERIALGLACGLLMFSAREQVPFITFGVGLFLCLRRRRPARKLGAGLAAASVVIFLLELKAIRSAQASGHCFYNWNYFNNLGGSPEMLLRRALTRPWDFVFALADSPAKFRPVLQILAHAAFLPVFAGAYFLPALIAWIPHQLAPVGSNYQTLIAHYPACVLGPLLWAMLHGLMRIQVKINSGAWRKLACVVLLTASWGFLGAPRFHDPRTRVIPLGWRLAAPKALAMIPPRAKVWADGYLLPQLAMRRYIKGLPSKPSDCNFETGLFMPDFILISLYWATQAPPPFTESFFRFVRERGFAVALREGDLILFANPKADLSGDSPPQSVRLDP